MGKQADTGAYWANQEYELVSHAMCMDEILKEFVECSADDDPDLWFFYDTRAALGRLIDAFEPPEAVPEKDNVISFRRRKALKR